MKNRKDALKNEKLGILLFQLSTPAVIGMMVNSLYNVVDAIFVGRGVGTLAIGAISIAFPVQMIVLALGQMIGIGGSSIISRSLGANDTEKAEKVLGNMLFLILFITVPFAVISMIFLPDILVFFGATPEILPYAQDYMEIIILGMIFFTFMVTMNNVVRAEGNAKISMFSMSMAALINVILDPFFIFYYKFGIKGAAIATVISQLITSIYLLSYLLSGKSIITFHSIYICPSRIIIKEILAIGASSLSRMAASSISAMVLNRSLAFYGGNIALAAFGIVNRLVMLTFMPMFGIVQGLQPIVGFNYGARQYKRVVESIKYTLKALFLLSTVIISLLQFFPYEITSIFTRDNELLSLGVIALKKMTLAIPFVTLLIVTSSVYQSLGRALPALFLSISRQVFFLIPFALLLPHIFGLNGLWYSFPASDMGAATLSIFLLLYEMKKINLMISKS